MAAKPNIVLIFTGQQRADTFGFPSDRVALTPHAVALPVLLASLLATLDESKLPARLHLPRLSHGKATGNTIWSAGDAVLKSLTPACLTEDLCDPVRTQKVPGPHDCPRERDAYDRRHPWPTPH